MPAPAERSKPRRRHRLRLGQLLALIGAAPLVMLAVSVAVGIVTVENGGRQRNQLLNRVEPAESAALKLTGAMLNQETGIRGYELTDRREFLAPYELGRREQLTEAEFLSRDRLRGTGAPLRTALAAIAIWERRTAGPAIRAVGRSGAVVRPSLDVTIAGKRQFDEIRRSLGTLQGAIEHRVAVARAALESSSQATRITLGAIAVVLLIGVVGAGIALHRLVSRPILRLTAATRRVAGGDLHHSMAIDAPLDIEQLAADVDAMRVALLRELAAANAARGRVAAAAAELERSNRELEQFAYVASHDLQEPLRKVTSFCQLLQDRYGGELDETADQYIAFAVDGAHRMQQLIADLLEFSRVGHVPAAREPADLRVLAESARSDLQEVADAVAAEVTIGALPVVPVETSLMRAVFQNLMANAIKFRATAPPRVELAASRDGDEWLITCSDNGIGIEPEYAERIFVIFQRLHSRDAYPGTGIGLAMCRKIVEYHGGRIWVDPAYRDGTRICFTLPADVSEPAAPPALDGGAR